MRANVQSYRNEVYVLKYSETDLEGQEDTFDKKATFPYLIDSRR